MGPTMMTARGAPPGPPGVEPPGVEGPGVVRDPWVVSGGVLIAEAATAVVVENRARAARWDAVSRFHAERVAELEAARAARRARPDRAGAGWFGLTPLRATVAEFAPLFGVGEMSIEVNLDVVDGIKQWFPGVWERCLAGRMDLGRAQLCWEQLSNLTCEADQVAYAELVEDWVARHDNPEDAVFGVGRERLRRAVRRMCLKFPQYDPQTEFAAAFKKRGVRLRTEDTGIAHLSGSMGVHDGMVADYRLTLIAKRLAQEPGETRTLEQLRADTLVDLLLGRLTVTVSGADLDDHDDGTDHDGTDHGGTDHGGTDHDGTDHGDSDSDDGSVGGGVGGGGGGGGGSRWCRRVQDVGAFARPVVNVTVSIGTLLGFSDEPATMAGGIEVPAELARRIANQPGSTWYRMLTDQAGGFVELSTESYAPTAPIERWTVARDQTCRWPGCHRPASVCECDHRVPHPIGATCTENLGCLCRRHHLFKHSEGVTVVRHDDGSYTWTTRFGSTFHTPPPEYPTGTLDGNADGAPDRAPVTREAA